MCEPLRGKVFDKYGTMGNEIKKQRMFVVTYYGLYDDCEKIIGVFESEELADSFIESDIRSKSRKNIGKESFKTKMACYDIEEFELNTFNRIERIWHGKNEYYTEEVFTW